MLSKVWNLFDLNVYKIHIWLFLQNCFVQDNSSSSSTDIWR